MRKVFLFVILSLQLISFAKESIKPDFIFKLKEVAQSNNFIDMGIVWTPYLTVDYMGNVFILGRKYNKVIKLDKNLKLIKTFGKKGEGPGEFYTGTAISVDKKGNICVMDNMKKIVVFNNSGKFKNEFKTASIGMFGSVKVIDNKFFVGNSFGRGGFDVKIFDIYLKKVISSFKLLDHDLVLMKENGGVLAFYPHFLGRHLFMDESMGFCVIGESQRLWLKLIDPKGNICLTLKRDEKRKKLSHKEIVHFTDEYIGFFKHRYTRNDIRKSLEKYEYKNVIREIKISNSRIYLFLTPDDTTIENKFPVEVYSFKGELINKGFSPVVPEKIFNNFFYVIKTDKSEDEDTRKLIKYKIIYNK